MTEEVRELYNNLILALTMNNQRLLLMCGEMTPQEIRTAQAVLAWARRTVDGHFKGLKGWIDD